MTEKQILNEIQRSLNGAPENLLYAVLDLLKQWDDQSADRVRLCKSLHQILTEDKKLLESLAK